MATLASSASAILDDLEPGRSDIGTLLSPRNENSSQPLKVSADVA
jgi:hypothetical protein